MHIPFDQLPEHSRLWIYQAARELNESEVSKAETLLKGFTEQWAAHGQGLKASYQILHQRFLILGVDQQHHEPSGCSIDSSVAVIRELEQAFGTSFFERTLIPFRINGQVEVVPMSQIKEKVAQGELSPETPTFNHLVANKAAWEQGWEVPAKDTWLSRYF